MSNSGLCHDWDGNGGHDLFDHFWVGHAGYAALGADVCWDTLGLLVMWKVGEGMGVEGWVWRVV